jgi:hypothetical protein
MLALHGADDVHEARAIIPEGLADFPDVPGKLNHGRPRCLVIPFR